LVIATYCTLLWGSAFPTLKITYKLLNIKSQNVGMLTGLAAMRLIIATGMICIFNLLISRVPFRVNKAQFKNLFILGLLQTALEFVFFNIGLAHTTGIKSAVLIVCNTFFTVIISHFFFQNDRINMKKIIGLICGFTGVIIINLKQVNGFNFDFHLMGEGFLIITTLLGGIGNVMTKKLTETLHPITIAIWQTFIGSLLLILFSFIDILQILFSMSWFAALLIFHTSFISAATFILWFTLLKYNKSGEIVLFSFLTPVFGAIMSALFIPGEHLTQNSVFALVLVAAGIWIVNYTNNIKSERNTFIQN
jgi:drug/metabolite transporter (DMT)-like permease